MDCYTGHSKEVQAAETAILDGFADIMGTTLTATNSCRPAFRYQQEDVACDALPHKNQQPGWPPWPPSTLAGQKKWA